MIGRWIFIWEASRRPIEEQIRLLWLKGVVGTKGFQCKNVSRSDGEMPSDKLYPDLEARNNSVDSGEDNSG